MNARQEKIEALFDQALKIEPDQRSAFLAGGCGGDAGLRQQVEMLLQADFEAGGFLPEQPLDAKTTVVPITEKAGDRIGRYKLLQQIGEGGCGVVYMAEQEEPVRRRVALKVIKLGMDTRSVIARFEAERQALAMMDHPNIAKVLDAGATDTGRPYFVMELVRGVRITEYCDENDLPTRERLDLFIKVCQAIHHAHQKGVIHRDIKPSNILVTINDDVPVPKVIDFGIAKATEQRLTEKTLFTELQSFIGTPAYMSPEQAVMTSLDIDTRSDIYALGVLLYELLTGQTPFDARELLAAGFDEMRRTLREKEPARPSTRLSAMAQADLTATARRRSTDTSKLVHLLRGDLDWVVMKCLEKDRTRRYEAASGLAADVQRYLKNEPVTARPPSAAYRFQKMVRRNKLAFAAAVAVSSALLLGATIGIWQAVRARQAELTAEANLREARQARGDEVAQRRAAESERDRANANASEIRLNLYASDIGLAHRLIREGDLTQARAVLDRWWPEGPELDLRGWEWRHLWNRCEGDQLFAIPQPGIGFRAMAAFNDGRRVVVACDVPDKPNAFAELRLLDLENRGESQSLIRGTNFISSISLSQDERWLALARSNGAVDVLETEGWRTTQSLGPYSNEVSSIGFARRGRSLIVVAGRRIDVWDVESGARRGFAVRPSLIWSSTVSADGRFVIGSDLESVVHVWDVEAEREVDSSSGFFGYVSGAGQIAVSADNQTVAVGNNDASIKLWHRPGNSIVTLGRHGSVVTSVGFSHDGKRLVTADDASLKVWDVSTGRQLARFASLQGGISRVTFAPDDRRILSIGRDGNLRVWPPTSRHEWQTLGSHAHWVTSVDMTPDGKLAVTGGRDRMVKVWDLAQGSLLRILDAHSEEVSTVAFSPDGRFVASGSFKHGSRPTDAFCVKVQGVGAGSEVATLNTGNHRVRCVRYSPDARWLAVSADDRKITLWDTATWKPGGRFEGHQGFIYDFVFTRDSRTLISADWDPEARLLFWDIPTQTLSRELSLASLGIRRGLKTLQLSPDEKVLAVGTWDAKVVLLDVRTLRTLAILETRHGSTESMAFSSDGRTLFVGYQNSTIKLWHLPTRKELFSLEGHESFINDLALAPDGDTLITAGADHTVRRWQAPSLFEIERRLRGTAP